MAQLPQFHCRFLLKSIFVSADLRNEKGRRSCADGSRREGSDRATLIKRLAAGLSLPELRSYGDTPLYLLNREYDPTVVDFQ